MMNSEENKKFTARKEKIKKFRSILQVLFLLAIVTLSVSALVILDDYVPYQQKKDLSMSGDKGFIAISYFGVDRTGNQNLIGVDQLEEHLQALAKQGYVTITQKDILDYYETGKELPEKSLFLIFEDGRRDTAIFSEKLLEKLNFKATMLTYPEKFAKKDLKFLMPNELIELEKSSFWEMGSNGYRLAFINVFDRYDNYLGELDPLQYAMNAQYLGRKYNHYLMDYIRDENGFPKESYNNMEKRISYDYEALRDIYQESIGYVPGMYILMHSNTGSFGNNDKVSAVNEYWIKNLFKMNFNREGYCFNQKNSSVYDLTRMQPQAYWQTNHLLMRIQHDIKQDIEFVKGDLNKSSQWEDKKGATEFKNEKIILTSLPLDSGLIKLKNSELFKDMKLSVKMAGNKFGMQKIYIRADNDLNNYTYVSIINNVLVVNEKINGVEKNIFWLNLDKVDGKKPISISEDKKAAEMKALESFAKYADSVKVAKVYTERLKDKSLETTVSVDEGDTEYIPDININAKDYRRLYFEVKDDKLTLYIDDKLVVNELKIANNSEGSIYLESAWGGYGWSQRNIADDVYDGIFEALVITENVGNKDEKILFDARLQGVDKVMFKVKSIWDSVINWFICYL